MNSNVLLLFKNMVMLLNIFQVHLKINASCWRMHPSNGDMCSTSLDSCEWCSTCSSSPAFLNHLVGGWAIHDLSPRDFGHHGRGVLVDPDGGNNPHDILEDVLLQLVGQSAEGEHLSL